jgi:hypothetical protein
MALFPSRQATGIGAALRPSADERDYGWEHGATVDEVGSLIRCAYGNDGRFQKPVNRKNSEYG